jgi:predicted esterase YcpF (UPF0227 family)
LIILYIHGFNSSPDSYKARAFGDFLAKTYPGCHYQVPKLSDVPDKAIGQLSAIIEKAVRDQETVALVGSSLGGFYATWLAQRHCLKAVLINPAVNPHILLHDYLGTNRNFYTGEEYELTSDHITQLENLLVAEINAPENLLVLVQKGDEILDYRLAETKYADSHLILEEKGDHSFQGVERYFDKIYQFLAQ